jgi:membrane protease YdiL (CAAX protease family)
LVVLMAVVVAPAFEEFMFRVLLQGWLEAVWSRARRKQHRLRAAPASWVPLVLPAALFALMHFRSAAEPQSSDYLSTTFLTHMAAEIFVIVFAVAVLRNVAGAKAADFGFAPRKLGQDAPLGIAAVIAVAPPLLIFNLTLTVAFQRYNIHVAPDPLPLFFLALVFGLLYRRTHRIAPSLVMHAAFNATSLGLFFLRP